MLHVRYARGHRGMGSRDADVPPTRRRVPSRMCVAETRPAGARSPRSAARSTPAFHPGCDRIADPARLLDRQHGAAFILSAEGDESQVFPLDQVDGLAVSQTRGRSGVTPSVRMPGRSRPVPRDGRQLLVIDPGG